VPRSLDRGFLGLGGTAMSQREQSLELYGRDTTNREILTGEFKTPAVAGKFERLLRARRFSRVISISVGRPLSDAAD